MNENQPTVAQLAILTAQLAAHQIPELTGENWRANFFQWKPPTHIALELWQQCEIALSELPDGERSTLQIDLPQLASLAAALSQGKDLRAEGVHLFVEFALRVWRDSRAKLENPTDCQQFVANAVRDRLAQFPDNPVPLKKALHRWMPQKRHPDRIKLFRQFLREDIFSHQSDRDGNPRRNDESTILTNTQQEIERLMREGITKNDPYAVRFPLWLDEHSEQEKQVRASKGGDAKAFKHALKLAIEGNAKAQETVALMYEAGRGVKQDSAEASKWMAEANRQRRQRSRPAGKRTIEND